MAQGRDALKRSDYTQAVQSFQSATALKPSDEGFKELAQAKAQQEQALRTRAADEQAKHEAEAKRQRDAAVARAEGNAKRRKPKTPSGASPGRPQQDGSRQAAQRGENAIVEAAVRRRTQHRANSATAAPRAGDGHAAAPNPGPAGFGQRTEEGRTGTPRSREKAGRGTQAA